jgi:hypothetical protein
VVGVQVELLSVEVLMEIFQHPHDGQLSASGDAVISLSLIQCLTVVGHYSLLSILYLGQHSSNTDVTRVYVNDKRIGAVQRASFSVWKAASTSGVHWNACFSSSNLVSSFTMLAKLEIHQL